MSEAEFNLLLDAVQDAMVHEDLVSAYAPLNDKQLKEFYIRKCFAGGMR